jgi:hypothetical protein
LLNWSPCGGNDGHGDGDDLHDYGDYVPGDGCNGGHADSGNNFRGIMVTIVALFVVILIVMMVTLMVEVMMVMILDVCTYEGRGDDMTDYVICNDYHDDLRTDCGYICRDDYDVIDDNLGDDSSVYGDSGDVRIDGENTFVVMLMMLMLAMIVIIIVVDITSPSTANSHGKLTSSTNDDN